MTILDKLRLKYGLRWHLPAWRVIALVVIDILLAIGCIALISTLIVTGNSWFSRWKLAEEKLVTVTLEKDKAEQVVLACLRHDVVKVNNDVRICTL